MLAFAVLAALQGAPRFPSPIERLVRIAGGSAVRDNPTALATPAGTIVVWEEVRGSRYLLVQGGLEGPGDSIRTPAVLVDRWGHQWGPSLAARGDTTWLACYVADVSLRTGDRDVVVLRYRDRLGTPLDTLRVTRDPPGAPFPVNDASPSLYLAEKGGALVAWSSGAFHEERPFARAYDDKDILEAELRDGKTIDPHQLTTARERGREMSPALAGHVLAYLSQVSGAPYALKLAEFDARWRLRSSRIVARSSGGIAHPSLLRLKGVTYLAWTDNTSTDVTIARLDRNLRVVARQSLRAALVPSSFSSYGPALAGLSGVQLFDDGGKIGLAFVATMEYEPAVGKVRQEIFLARFR